eukprot:m.169789 g.169789  ORF g.169789 m.169789 type:complete len:297 (+) comp14508_c0_seq1:293-1183(+)
MGKKSKSKGSAAAAPEDKKVSLYQQDYDGEGSVDLSLRLLREVSLADLLVFKRLHTIDLSMNELTVLPAQIGKLTGLKVLDLRKNHLTALPTAIGELAVLESLDISDNELTDLPVSFGQLKKLRWLDVENNPWDSTAVPEAFREASAKDRQSGLQTQAVVAKKMVEWFHSRLVEYNKKREEEALVRKELEKQHKKELAAKRAKDKEERRRKYQEEQAQELAAAAATRKEAEQQDSATTVGKEPISDEGSDGFLRPGTKVGLILGAAAIFIPLALEYFQVIEVNELILKLMSYFTSK